MKKFLVVFMTVVLMCSTFVVSSSAASYNSTYADVVSTSSQANNLISYAFSYKGFLESDYVIFCDVQNSYYIVWGDLTVQNGKVTGSDVQTVHYYRPSGTNNSYEYVYSTETTFSLDPDHVCTSNLENYGFQSALFSQYKHYDDCFKFLLFVVGFLFVITVVKLRGDK